MLEIEEETRDFLTINKKDFNEKRVERTKKFIAPCKYEPPYNVINGSCRKHLTYSADESDISIGPETENISKYLEKIRRQNAHLAKFLPEDISRKDIIEREEKKLWKSVYQLDYSKNSDDLSSLNEQQIKINTQRILLPHDWTVPETIYGKSYRDTRHLGILDPLIQNHKALRSDNLGPNINQRTHLHAKTGDSEYTCVIGATGIKLLRAKKKRYFVRNRTNPSSKNDSKQFKEKIP